MARQIMGLCVHKYASINANTIIQFTYFQDKKGERRIIRTTKDIKMKNIKVCVPQLAKSRHQNSCRKL